MPQIDHTASPGQLVTSNTYDWLQQQEGPLHENKQYEVHHSVFKPLDKYAYLSNDPTYAQERERKRQSIRQKFEYVVSECLDAFKTYHVELRRIKAGSSGSYFVYGRDPQSGPLGVFKPKDEEPYGPLSPKWTKWMHRTFFPCFFGRSCLIPNLGYICESAASLLDERLGLGMVPPTDTVVLESHRFYDQMQTWLFLCGVEPRLQKKLGSFQLFLYDYMGAEEFLAKYPLPGMYRDHPSLNQQINQHLKHENQNSSAGPQDKFEWTEVNLMKFRLELEKLIILDYIMRNTDRGLDNWMVKVVPIHRKAGTTWNFHLAAIDNGLTFPWKHPDEWRSYPYGWLYLPVHMLAQPFSESTRRHFLPLLTSEQWWSESYKEFTALFSRDSDFKIRMWRKQWAVLKGQAFNVVETLRDIRQGPLELVRRTRCLVLDEKMQVPIAMPILNTAINERIPIQAGSPMNLYSSPAGINEVAHQREDDDQDHSTAPFTSKTVIIEHLEIVTNTPVLTWC
ncbi:ZYRO0F01958p [Zygosaccharomyces rouxii]|uniref:Phosphatidylinositol 4-kinase n=1 Tax=Zygosaccharomyces rouxii (strain ATCC 2623 / CBS 732 / NBRC 1130 / NCYC 568 / NRRL Y-229) TaxID=559307 RepID=C5DX37_ZYGRC|nr:uncharacterized protein ZYRO0F01958g [Zygosaccharomyces rouxii]KAH9199113.1 phosphatidylinositol 3 and 4-kinase-domain-containing protein [Zygosaccharomyces rouxii]CAR28348.1 ZYRO0F01958p [Zygosaccharomyces rouxii]